MYLATPPFDTCTNVQKLRSVSEFATDSLELFNLSGFINARNLQLAEPEKALEILEEICEKLSFISKKIDFLLFASGNSVEIISRATQLLGTFEKEPGLPLLSDILMSKIHQKALQTSDHEKKLLGQ